MQRAIDVSRYEGNYPTNTPPNWAGAVLDGVQIGVVKVMQGRTADPMFEYNWRAINRQGLTRSGYSFWTVSDGTYEADLFSRTLLGVASSLDFPPVLDFEPNLTTYPTRIPNVDMKVKSWLDRVEENVGQKPMIYTGVPYWERHFPTAPEWLGDYKLWIAAYPTVISVAKNQWDLSKYSYSRPRLPRGWTYEQLYMWQFTDKGSIPGFSGGVDLDYYYPTGFLGG